MTLVSVEQRARELIATASQRQANRIVALVEEHFMAEAFGLPLLSGGTRRERIEDRIGRILYACAGQSVADIHVALTMAEIRSLDDGALKPALNG